MPRERELTAQINRHVKELDRRARAHRELEPYFAKVPQNQLPIPPAIVKAKLTNLYRDLMGMAQTPWGRVIVNAKLDRLEVTGVSSGNHQVDDAVFGVWQDNGMDLESKLGHSAALLDGRVHALVWPRDGMPEISLDDVTQMVVEFEEGSRRHRAAASRRWRDDDGRDYVTLYRRDGIYKFRTKAPNEAGPKWERREVKGETWPLKNPLKIVPAVEIGTNRRIKAGPWTHCGGEFEDVTGVIDRIHLLTFLGLVVAIWMGFPLRGVIGDKILQDDDGNDLPPFESRPDSVVQFESKDAKVFQLDAADRKNLSVYPEFNELALATGTPRHYLPVEGGFSNIAEATIRAFESPMHAAVAATHKPFLSEGWEETLRLAGLMLDTPAQLPQRASLQWADHESRSLSERADAFVKLTNGDHGLPWQAAASLALNMAQDDIRKYEAQHAGTAIANLLRDARNAPGGTLDEEDEDGGSGDPAG